MRLSDKLDFAKLRSFKVIKVLGLILRDLRSHSDRLGMVQGSTRGGVITK